MIQLFKKGSADRLLLLLAFFLLAHAPFLFANKHLLLQELLRIRLGERLAEGWRLYAQVADDTAPLPAFLYALLAKSSFLQSGLLRWLAALLIWQQAIWFNNMAFRFQLVSERNYLIAFFYLIFIHLGVDTVSLSPALCSLSFLLFAFGKFFKILKDGANPEDAMLTGLWLGFGSLCFQPVLVFIIPICLAAILFSGLRVNHFLLMFFASVLPGLAVYVIYLYSGGVDDFIHCFSAGFRIRPFLQLIDLRTLIVPALGFLLVSLFGWILANQQSRVNFQRLGFNVFFLSALAGFAGIFMGSVRSNESLLLLLPMASFFMAQLIIFGRKKLFMEWLGILITSLFLGGFYLMASPANPMFAWHQGLFSGEPPKGFSANFSGKKVMLLSNDFRYYVNNKPAGRFLRFYLGPLSPAYSQTYEGLIYWYQCLSEDPPQIIYDPSGLIPELSLRMPEFRRCYRTGFYPDLYEAIPGKVFGLQKP